MTRHAGNTPGIWPRSRTTWGSQAAALGVAIAWPLVVSLLLLGPGLPAILLHGVTGRVTRIMNCSRLRHAGAVIHGDNER